LENSPATSSKGEHKVRPYRTGTLPGTIGRFIQAFKSWTTQAYIFGVNHHAWPPFEGRFWQRNYYEHIIRNQVDLARIQTYVRLNPTLWPTDPNNPR
jgi:hypothetical protein